MGRGFQDFMNIDFSRPSNDDVQALIVKEILKIDELMPEDIPMDTTLIDWNDLMTKIIDPPNILEKIKAIKKANLVFKLDDSVYHWNELQIGSISVLKELKKYVDAQNRESKSTYLNTIMKTLIQFLIRLRYDQLSDEVVVSVVRVIKEILPNSIYIDIIKICALSYQLAENTDFMSFVSTYFPPISELLKKIYEDSEIGQVVLPIICTRISRILWAATMHTFSRPSYIIQERLSCSSSIPHLMLTIAAYCPDALEEIKWKPIIQYFLRKVDNIRDFPPSHLFILQNPSLVFYSQTAECIIALAAANFFFSNLVDPSQTDLKESYEPNEPHEWKCNNDIFIGLLNAIATRNTAGQHAVSQVMVNAIRTPTPKPAINAFVELIKGGNREAAALYVNVMKGNFTPHALELEERLGLASIIGSFFGSTVLSTAVEELTYLTMPKFDLDLTLTNLLRSADALLAMKQSKAFVAIHETNAFAFILTFINGFMKSWEGISDIRVSLPFFHLCATAIQLYYKYVQNTERSAIGFDYRMILLIYDQITLCAEPVMRERQMFDSFTSSILMERDRIAEALAPRAADLFGMTVLEVCEESPSLRLAAMVLLLDVCEHSIERQFLVDIAPDVAAWAFSLAASESRWVTEVVFQVFKLLLVEVQPNSPNIHLVTFQLYYALEVAYKKLSASTERCFTRILFILMKLLSDPIVKDKLSVSPQYKRSINICKEMLQMAITYPVAARIACDCLMLMMSPSVSLVPHVDEKFRICVDTIPYEFFEGIAKSVINILTREGIDNSVKKNAIQLLRFNCTNPFWIDTIKSLNFTITLESLRGSELYEDQWFMRMIISAARAIAEYDTAYAAEFIGIETAVDELRSSRFDDEEIADLLRILEHTESTPKKVGFKLEDVQAATADARDAWLRRKMRARSVVLPPKTGYNFLTKLPPSYSGYSYELKAQQITRK